MSESRGVIQFHSAQRCQDLYARFLAQEGPRPINNAQDVETDFSNGALQGAGDGPARWAWAPLHAQEVSIAQGGTYTGL